jgi:hypothetical protein
MAMIFTDTLFIQIGLVQPPYVKQGADGHAMTSGIFGPKKKNKKKQQKSDYGNTLHAPAFPGVF